MANRINELQNETVALRLLAAQRRRYGWAKTLLTVQVAVVVAGPGVLLILEHAAPSFGAWAAFLGLLFSVLDVAVFEPAKTYLQRKAAALQEVFDCRVLDLEWSELKGVNPDLEDADAPASGTRGLRDWYPAGLASLPLHVARIICQRSNRWWDARLRRVFRVGLLCSVVLISVSLTFVALARQLTVGDFVVTLLAPILPLVLWSVRQARRQGEAARRLDRLKSFGDHLWADVLSRSIHSEQATTAARQLQDEIFEHRRRSPLVFDWVYRCLLKDFQGRLAFSAAEFVSEAKAAGL